MTFVPPNFQPSFFMSQAIKLGDKSRIISPPNPWVGCVIVKEGEIIGRGSTETYGGSHAEIKALKEAGENARGSTVYVTLEPCPNHGKTPPCTDALIQAKVKKVVIALIDPDPKVLGRGIQKLREANIDVEVGLLEEKAKKSLLPYLHHRETGMPFCILKAAISIDGKIAAKDGTSLWITGEKARKDVHQIRAESQAVLVGTNTILEDSPSLTVRYVQPSGFRPPLRVLLDISGKIKAQGPLFDMNLAPTLIVTSEKCPESIIEEWKSFGCEVKSLPLNERRD
jgi:diaminohydroxyphosphoribosylaminopyrimidine deaminase/5-amino-6-(5-phosphoribosylamino)uracil reductase